LSGWKDLFSEPKLRKMIFHITTEVDWKRQEAALGYAPPMYEMEGFIHCCTKDQLSDVQVRYYKNQTGLLLLHLDETKLENSLIYEKSTNDELFPHLYGMINKSAVILIEKIA